MTAVGCAGFSGPARSVFAPGPSTALVAGATARRLCRCRFLAQSALAGAVGLVPVRAAFEQSPPPQSVPPARFAPAAAEPDAAVFAAARKRLLFPETITYCNTGTLGASPWDVVTALRA